MSVKTITIKNDVYNLLSSMKWEGESFSELLLRLVSRKADMMDFYGKLSESHALEEIEKEILEERKKSVLKDVRL